MAKASLSADSPEPEFDAIIVGSGFAGLFMLYRARDVLGQWVHTGAWPQEGVDVTGKRVGLIGTGSTGIKAEGPKTYLGLQTSGFPNLFTITGPGSPSVPVNMPTAIEQHVEWISACIGSMQKRGQRRIEATVEAEKNESVAGAEPAQELPR
jgi:cation diffusion facilitator CzcD-associated flavoprotein CzcO